MRRFLALLTTLSMLHLLLVGWNDTCASHHERAAATAALTSAMSVAMTVAMSADMPTRDAASAAHHETDNGAPADCTTTNGTHCCDAVGSCTMTAETTPIVRSFTGVLCTVASLPLAESDPDSVWTSPEPPPPKA